MDVDVDVICVDTAHGHSAGVLDMIRQIKKQFPDLQVVGGNVATDSAAAALGEAGVDAVNVGVGPGRLCTTRVVAGVGELQLSDVCSAERAIQSSGVAVIGDGRMH